MNFNKAYQEMLNGKKIRRPGWGGYWFIEDGKVKIKLKTGEIIENDFNQETITNTLADDWEVVEEKKKWWKPEMYHEYYLIRWNGDINFTTNSGSSDSSAMAFGNCFQTEEQAQFVVEKLKVIHELKTFAVENNEEEIDWNDVNQTKYYLGMFQSDKIIAVFSTYKWCYTPFNIYFTSEEIAEKAIETIGEDRIKKYYFGVEDE